MYRLVALPPGAPREAVDALRAAIVKLASDKAYLNEAIKLMGDVPEYVTGATLNEDVRKALSISPELKAFMEAYAKRAK
jgi:tripartite-type tricarboxylate transporter receptor subunit TctC